MSEKKLMPLRTQHEERVLRAAREYARMKKFGVRIENDVLCSLTHNDAANSAEYLAKQVLRAAEDLLNAMSIDEVNGELVP